MNPILIAKVVAGLLLVGLLWFGVDRAVLSPRREAADLQAQLDAEKLRTEQIAAERTTALRELDNARRSEKLVATYEEKIRDLEARKPAVVTRLVERVCPVQPAAGKVPGAAAEAARPPDGSSQADAGDGFAAGLAADIAACRANAEQLTALQGWVSSVR